MTSKATAWRPCPTCGADCTVGPQVYMVTSPGARVRKGWRVRPRVLYTCTATMVSAAGTLPGMRPPPGRPWVIAHRGASAAFPENTLAAFSGAAALGADAVEFDVRRTADGAAVVHHDAEVPGVGAIVTHTAAALRRRAPWVPTLAEALAACGGMWVDVEVKNSPADPDWDPDDTLVARVIAHLREEGWLGAVLLTSFNPATLARARSLAPGLSTGRLVEAAEPLPAAPARAAAAGHAALLPHAAALAGDAAVAMAAEAHRVGIGLMAWTVDDPQEGRRLAAAGLDGIITNRPDALRSALDEHRHHDGG